MEKVLIISPNFLPESVGGASRIYEMAKEIQNKYDVSVICPPPTYPFTKYKKSNHIFQKQILDGITIYRIWTYQPSTLNPSFLGRFLYYMIFPILTNLFLFSLLRNVSFVIISTPPTSLLITSWMVRLFRKKLIVDVRDLWIDALISLKYLNKNNPIVKWVKRFEISCWKKSNIVLANSLTTIDRMKQILGTNSTKIKYFPFRTDLKIFKKENVETEKQIVYIGNFGISQALDILIKSMPIVFSKIPDVVVKLYGGGFCEEKIQDLVKELGLEKSIQFFNPVSRDQIPLILSKSLVGIVSLEDKEGLRSAIPTKTFEYLACSLPIFAYGGSQELKRIIKESDAGVFIEGNNHKAIGDSLIKLLNDKEKIKQYSINGRKFMGKKIDLSFLEEI
jgi:colanic acid biosynthesis glycosyl transferase WcaI